MTYSLTPTLARRLTITRQRLAGPRPEPTPEGIMDLFRDLRCVQIDPIRAVEYTQRLVLWSRLGSYDPAHLDTLLWEERQLFEYWAHAASIVLTEDYLIHEVQMRQRRPANPNSGWHRRMHAWIKANESFRQHILDRLRHEGPLASREIEDLSTTPWGSTGWTNERNVGRMLDFLWTQGEIMVATRQGVQKKWGLTEHHLPDWPLRETLSDEEMVRQAAQISLRALGVGTAKQINNHFIRGNYPGLDSMLAALVAEERIIPVSIGEGELTWPGEWYIHAADLPLLEQLAAGSAWQPRTTLLSPFDNLICDRERTELMWDFYFRIEIYVPKAKRQYGYYVLPILHGDRLIGRIDPKMDRKTGKLHINAIYAEADTPQDAATAQAIAAAITDLARFLGAKEIVYGEVIPPAWQQLVHETALS
jgi:uncharacterized protein YcaQ